METTYAKSRNTLYFSTIRKSKRANIKVYFERIEFARFTYIQVGESLMCILYCLLMFALIGGQLFSEMDFFCVKNNKTGVNVTYRDLTHPIQRCPFKGHGSRGCPSPYQCSRLDFPQRGENVKWFNHIGSSLLTVYEGMSLEGWSSKMFETMDLIPKGKKGTQWAKMKRLFEICASNLTNR